MCLICRNITAARARVATATLFCMTMKIFPRVILLVFANSPFTTETGSNPDTIAAGTAPEHTVRSSIRTAQKMISAALTCEKGCTSFPIRSLMAGENISANTSANANAANVSISASVRYLATIPLFWEPRSLRVAISLALNPVCATVREM